MPYYNLPCSIKPKIGIDEATSARVVKLVDRCRHLQRVVEKFVELLAVNSHAKVGMRLGMKNTCKISSQLII